MPSKKRATPVSLQPLDALFGTNEESINGISEIAIGSLHPFPNALALRLTMRSANLACNWLYFQEEEPDEVKRLRKF